MRCWEGATPGVGLQPFSPTLLCASLPSVPELNPSAYTSNLVCKLFSRVLWAVMQAVEPKEGVTGTSDRWSFRSTGGRLGWRLALEVGWSCGAQPFTRGIWVYLQVDSVRIELRYGTLAGVHREWPGVWENPYVWCQKWSIRKNRRTIFFLFLGFIRPEMSQKQISN